MISELRMFWRNGIALLLMAGICACSGRQAGPAAKTEAPPAAPGVDSAAIGLFGQHPGEWLSTGRTYSEQHYSPLEQITAANVARLGVAWEADLASPRFGIEATPVVANGVLYISGNDTYLYAFGL